MCFVILKSNLYVYYQNECKTIFLHIGSNECDNDTDIEMFAKHFESLITSHHDNMSM